MAANGQQIGWQLFFFKPTTWNKLGKAGGLWLLGDLCGKSQLSRCWQWTQTLDCPRWCTQHIAGLGATLSLATAGPKWLQHHLRPNGDGNSVACLVYDNITFVARSVVDTCLLASECTRHGFTKHGCQNCNVFLEASMGFTKNTPFKFWKRSGVSKVHTSCARTCSNKFLSNLFAVATNWPWHRWVCVFLRWQSSPWASGK